MKNLKPFGPSIGKTLISKRFMRLINKEIDGKIVSKKNDYKYILNDCKPTLIIVSNNDQFKKIKNYVNLIYL